MIIDILVCHADGTQTMEQCEVAADYFNPLKAEPPISPIPAKGESSGK